MKDCGHASFKRSIILGAMVLVIIGASVSVTPVNAKANFEHSNDVAKNANTNEPYMKECKEHNSAKDCATGPGNNGEVTSGAAHEINGP